MDKKIAQLREQMLKEADAVLDQDGFESFRIRYSGRKGLLPGLFGELAQLEPGDKPAAGKAIHAFKTELEAVLAEKQLMLESGAGPDLGQDFDATLPPRLPWRGSRHLLSTVLEEIITIFRGMGFSVADGPEVEWESYNFEALNFPADHPSRDLQDTFWIDDKRLLRTHTSPVQVRFMEAHPPPVRIVVPGRVYRNEAIDASHAAEFHQLEGLYVDKAVSLGDLTTTIRNFAVEYFGSDAKVRFRPHFFPFTEPSAEADMICVACGGKGCRVCGQTGWMEIMGAGMVHPNVFSAAGYDPEQVTGFAFGFGIERIAMLRYGIDDIRLFLENDQRFLAQF